MKSTAERQQDALNALAWTYRMDHRDGGNRAERRAFAAEKRGKGLWGWRQRAQRVGEARARSAQ